MALRNQTPDNLGWEEVGSPNDFRYKSSGPGPQYSLGSVYLVVLNIPGGVQRGDVLGMWSVSVTGRVDGWT